MPYDPNRWEDAGSASRWEDVDPGRADIMSELDRNPETKRLTMQMLDTEGGGAATIEALVNRTAMIRQKVPEWTLHDELNSGFYGPINRGYAQTLRLHPGAIARYEKDIDAVRAGSNVIQGRTDQGSLNDPNVHGPGRVFLPGNPHEVYNFWTGRRRGIDFSRADSAKFAANIGREQPQNSRWEDVTQEEPRPEDYRLLSARSPQSDQADRFEEVKPRDILIQDIRQTEEAGYKVPHFIGSDNEPEGDRAPTMDMENLVGALKQQEKDTGDPEIAKKRSYWESEIKTKGMSAKQWRDQTGEEDPAMKREVGAIEAGARGLKGSVLGLSEFVSRHGIAPFIHGVRKSIEAVEPDSPLFKFSKKVDDAFWERFVSDVGKQRQDTAINEDKEERTLAGQKGKVAQFVNKAAEMVGSAIPDIATAIGTGAAAPAIKGAGMVGQAVRGMGMFALPSAKAGMDAAKQVQEQGGSEKQQLAAFIKQAAIADVSAGIPIAAQSGLPGAVGRIASRTGQGMALGGATGEIARQAENALGGDSPFNPEQAALDSILPGLMGGVLGQNTAKPSPPKAPVGIVANPTAAKGFAAIGKKGAPPPVPRKPIIQPIRKDPSRTYQGVADILEKSGFKPLADKVRQYVDTTRKHLGRFDNPFRVWSKGLKSAQVQAADKQFQEYWRAVDSKDTALANKLYNAAIPEARAAIDIWKKTAIETGKEAKRVGLEVFDPATNSWRLMGQMGDKFFPRRVSKEWLEVLRNPHKYPEKYEQIRQEMIERGYAKDAAEADKVVESAISPDSGTNRISSIEHARTSQLPPHVYDYSIEAAREYIYTFSRELSKIEAFGQSRGGQVDTAFETAQKSSGDEYTKNYIDNVSKAIYDHPDGLLDPSMRLGRAISTMSFLGNYLSSLRNLVSGTMMNFQNSGIREGTKDLFSAGKAFKEIDSAYEKGILHDDLANMMTSDVSDFGKTLNKLTNQVLKWNAYKGVEEYTRAVSLMGARGKLRTMLDDAANNPLSKRAVNNAAYAKRLGIDPQALLDEGGEGPLTDRYMRAAVADLQGGYAIDQTPLFQNTEGGKTLFHLQKWGTQNLRYFDRNIINPALQAIKTGRKESVNLRDKDGNLVDARVPGSIRPLARYLLLLPAFGLAQQEAQEWIFGTPDREASFAEILMRMDDDALDALGLLAHKLYSASLNVGALGMIGTTAKAVEVAGIEGAFNPPPLQILKNAGKLVMKAWDQGTLTGNDIRKALSEQLSILRTTGQMAANIPVLRDMSPTLQMINKKQDLSWLRTVEKRFEDDKGFKRTPAFRGEFASGPMAPFYSSLEEKMLLGDAKGARGLIKEKTKGMSPEEEKLFMSSLKKSVAANRPISIAGSKGEAPREAFLNWARKNLPMSDVARIKSIDDTYRKTATRLDLFAPKPVKDFNKAMEEFTIRNRLRSGQVGE